MSQLDVIKTLDMKRLLMAVAMTAFIVNSAWAVEPKTDSVVTGDKVTVGDVFDGVTHDADYVLAPAPGYGKTLTLGMADLKRISDAFNLGWLPGPEMVQVVVHRNAREIDHYAIEAALQQKLGTSLQGQKFDMQLSDRNLNFLLPEGASAEMDVSNLRYDLAKGEFHALVSAPAGSDNPVIRQEVSGRLFPVTSVPVLKSALRSGDLITADDLDYLDVRNADLSTSAILSAGHLIGMTPRRAISPLKPVTASDIVPPVIVHKGDIVTMVLNSDTVSLTAQGKALENGAQGETVHVVNTTSNQSLQAVVTGAKTVSVTAPMDAGI